MSQIDKKLAELGITIPAPAKPVVQPAKPEPQPTVAKTGAAS